MYFDNHTPVNFDEAEILAEYRRDGGAYSGIGYTIHRAYKGRQIHLVHLHSSGCEYQGKTDHISEHLGKFDTTDALIAWLLKQPNVNWVNELLAQLNYKGDTA